jgi:SulP family sulfate permease
MPVIGGLIFVIGGELLWGRKEDIELVSRTATLPTVAMVATFLATTQFPLQDAILFGAGLSLLLFCAEASRQGHLYALERIDAGDTGDWRIGEVPQSVPSNAVTILGYSGSGLFAEVARVEESWPRTDDTHDAVIVLVVRTLPDIPSSTLLKAIQRRAAKLQTQRVRFMLVGVDMQTYGVFKRSKLLDQVGADNVVPATNVVSGALNAAVVDAEAWVRALESVPDATSVPSPKDGE